MMKNNVLTNENKNYQYFTQEMNMGYLKKQKKRDSILDPLP